MLKGLLQGCLSPGLTGRVNAHLVLCGNCLDAWGNLIDAAVASGEATLPPGSLPLPFWWKRVRDSYRRLLSSLGQVPVEIRSWVQEMLASRWTELEEYAETPAAEVVRRQMRGDPLFALVALGAGEREPQVEPFYYTALRQYPQELTWQPFPEAAGYLLTVYRLDPPDANGITGRSMKTAERGIGSPDLEPVVPVSPSILPLNSHLPLPVTRQLPQSASGWVKFPLPQVTPGKAYIWQVRLLLADHRTGKQILAGKFWVLSPEELARVQSLEKGCRSIDDPVLRSLALAALYQEAQLYGEAVAALRQVIAGLPAHPRVIPCRQALATLYQAVMEQVLGEELRLLRQVADWAGEAGREQLQLTYCMLLGNYGRYRNGECALCNDCGLAGKG